jgi:integrase
MASRERGSAHQDRRVTLDAEMVEVLREHRTRCYERAAALGTELTRIAFVFSPAPDGSDPTKPDTVTQRYGRLAARLAIDTRLHSLRHYSATERIAAGVDVRTVAGRLGHAGGGSTTLRTYTAFVQEADQRAAVALASRRVRRPALRYEKGGAEVLAQPSDDHGPQPNRRRAPHAVAGPPPQGPGGRTGP